jgi:hypothetical protein
MVLVEQVGADQKYTMELEMVHVDVSEPSGAILSSNDKI